MRETSVRKGRGDVARPRAMTRGVVLLTLTLLLGTIGFLLGAGSIGLSATRMGATVNLRKTKLGPVLVNAKGHTLYLFKKDTGSTSTCTPVVSSLARTAAISAWVASGVITIITGPAPARR